MNPTTRRPWSGDTPHPVSSCHCFERKSFSISLTTDTFSPTFVIGTDRRATARQGHFAVASGGDAETQVTVQHNLPIGWLPTWSRPRYDRLSERHRGQMQWMNGWAMRDSARCAKLLWKIVTTVVTLRPSSLGATARGMGWTPACVAATFDKSVCIRATTGSSALRLRRESITGRRGHRSPGLPAPRTPCTDEPEISQKRLCGTSAPANSFFQE